MNASLWVHDERYSSHELIVHSDLFSIGDVIGIKSNSDELILKATQTDSNPKLQISISQTIAQQFDLQPRSICTLRKIKDLDSIQSSRIEIAFRDQYIGRADMWQLKQSLLHSTIYKGKKVQSLGVKGHIKSITVGGTLKKSGYITDQTRFVFRSETAKFFLFIQMSKEMWEFDEDGEMFFEKCVYGFLPLLFSKWKEVGTNHVCSIVMFARVFFPTPMQDTLRDQQGRYFKDFYHVVMDWETRQDWAVILDELKKEFVHFQRDVLQFKEKDGSSVLSGENSTFKEGNVLEAINLALNPFDKHYIDRDLSRTGLSIVIITPGTGIFEVEKRLCRMTTQRMIDNGISLDLICLSKPPLHSTPLFLFQSKDIFQKTTVDSEPYSQSFATRSDKSDRVYSDYMGKSGTEFKSQRDHLYLDDELFSAGDHISVYMIPDWMDCSYWTRSNVRPEKFLPRCKMYEIQMTGLVEASPEMPFLDIFDMEESRDPTQICNLYDQSLFQLQKKKLRKKGQINEETESETRLAHAQSMGMEDFYYSERKLATSFPRGNSFTGGWPREYTREKERRDLSDIESEHPKSEVYSTSIEPIRIKRNYYRDFEHRGSCSSGSRGASPIPEYLRTQTKFSPSKTPTKHSQFLRHNYVDPFTPQKQHRVGINDRRWEHIPKWVSHEGNQLYTNWLSLCSPACLPLTIEYFPSPEELSEFYQEYTYTVSPANDNQIESLLVELISQRLAQGFQLIVSAAPEFAVGKPLMGSNQLISISKPYFLCLGDHVHRLFYDSTGNNIEVKRYTRRITYNTDPIPYSCAIWSKHTMGYQNRSVTFSYPALTTYNWNYLDHLISGYQDELTDALRFWRIRFLLIPLENPPTVSQANLSSDNLDEEEERLLGFQKFMDMIEKVHFVKSEGKKKHHFDIQYTTLNLSSLVKSEDMHMLLPEAFMTNPAEEDHKESRASDLLSRKTPIETIAKQLISPPPVGISLQDRHWHFQIFESVATGEEIIDWIIKNFSDVETREQGLEVGNLLIDNNILEHVTHKHRMLDGFYFYRFCPSWQSKMEKNQKRRNNVSKRFQAVKSVPLDLDPQKKSKRQEIGLLHYDTTHNTKNCYHFQLHWLVCTARLVEDMLHSWMRMAEKTGFKLVEAPGGQASLTGDDNPFQALFPIQLAVLPPSVGSLKTSTNVVVQQEYFEREFVKSFQFILDSESDNCFPPNSRGYSYQRKPWPHTQFVHRSGIAFIQILPDSKGFVWVNNRLYINASNSVRQANINPELLREQFEKACADKEGLQVFWAKVVSLLKAFESTSIQEQAKKDAKLFVE